MKTKRQKTLGSFWDVKAQPPVPLLQRALETSSKAASRRVSQKLQECRQKGETLVVLTEEELALAVEEKARLRGTPGRPATLPALQQQQQGSLVVGLQKKRPGATGARVEETAATKAAMAKELADMAAACASPQELQREAVKAFKKPWASLKKILAGRSVWETRVKELQLGQQLSTRKRGVNQFSKRGNMKRSQGCRRLGGGRKDSFLDLKWRLKAWLCRERELQHHVDKTDLMEAFYAEVDDEVRLIQRRLAGEPVCEQPETSAVQQVEPGPGFENLRTVEAFVRELPEKDLEKRVEELTSRKKRLQAREDYRKTFLRRLLATVGGMEHMLPGRLTQLTLEEEKAAVLGSWLDYDAALHLASSSSAEQLQGHVADPEAFLRHRK